MKKTIFYIGISVLLLNIIAGVMLSVYLSFNVIINSVVIAVTTVMIWLLSLTRQKTSFSIALTFLFIVVGLIQIVFGCLSPAQFHDNWMLLVVLALWVIDVILFIIVNTISKNIK